jgi:CspA family cold shock protein
MRSLIDYCADQAYMKQAIVACDGNDASRPILPFHASWLRATFARTSHVSRKEHQMPIGKVKFFNIDKGYGFIAPEGGGNDSFVHISAVERAGMTTLETDQRVSYDIENDQRGKASAVNLQAA